MADVALSKLVHVHLYIFCITQYKLVVSYIKTVQGGYNQKVRKYGIYRIEDWP